MDRPGQHSLRRGRASIAGQAYLLTSVCAGRRRCFADPAVAKVASRSFRTPRLWGDCTVPCWVLMPDHWHGLLVLGEVRSLSAVMQRAKSVVSLAVSREFGIRPLWQPGFHDRALRWDQQLRVAARYVVANPLRAGIVADLRQYPWWHSEWGLETLEDPFD
jgi:REP element-mobilizing transposase RayT